MSYLSELPLPEGVDYKLNSPLADEILEWIKRDQAGKTQPDEPAWGQATWYSERSASVDSLGTEHECLTSCCVAGYIGFKKDVIKMISPATLHRKAIRSPHTDKMLHVENHLGFTFLKWMQLHDWGYYQGGGDDDWGTKTVCWQDMGQFFLGITEHEASNLFEGNNTYADLIIKFGRLKEKYGV